MKVVRNIKLFYLISSLLILLIRTNTFGQYNNNYWAFGDSSGIDWSTNPPTLSTSSVKNWRGFSSIGNSNGIVAYAGKFGFNFPMNGKIWNRFHEPILNADFIYGEGWYHDRLFLPYPGSDSLLYLLSCSVSGASPFGLYYTLIDLKANNDSGAVIQKNVPLNSYPAFDALMAVQHGNGRDWWVLFQRWDGVNGNVGNNEISVYLVNSSGITLHSQQNIGAIHRTNGGHLSFNSDGSRFAVVAWTNLIQVYNFDRCTGYISLWNTIHPENTITFNTYSFSCAFSPDNSKLYVVEYGANTNLSELHQYDLTSANILNSKTIIYTFPTSDMSPADIKLAPDGRIYVATADNPLMTLLYPDSAYTFVNNNLSVINYPDSLGAACDFQPFSFNLGNGRTYFGLPNNPDYELGAWVGSPCDTLAVGLTPGPGETSPSEERGAWIQAWYNSEWNMIHINAAQLKGKRGVLRLLDMEGRIVLEKPAEVLAGGYYTTEIYMNEISNGVYIVQLVTEKEAVSFKTSKF